jgi:hypothetical protein
VVRNKRGAADERDALVERLREFIRLNYISVEETARRIGFSEGTLHSWLHWKSRPAEPERIAAFLDSLLTDRGSGIAPTGYEYREYKKLARHSKATPLSVLYAGERRDSKAPRRLSGRLSELWSDGAEEGKL